MGKSFLFLFFKKESAFFFEKKRIASGDRGNKKLLFVWFDTYSF